MASNPSSERQAHEALARELAALRQSAASAREFWPRYLGLLLQLVQGDRAVLLVRPRSPAGPWKRLLDLPPQVEPSRLMTDFLAKVEGAAERCAREGSFHSLLEPPHARPSGHYLLALRLALPQGQEDCAVILLKSEAAENEAREALLRLDLAAEVPQSFLLQQAVQQARADVDKIASTLDTNLQVNAQKRFLAASLAFCNGLADRLQCDRVSLGWLERGDIRLRTMSRTERFNRQMAAARALEMAMEEALDQDDEIVWPAPEGTNLVRRDHEQYSREQNVPHLCSLPLRVDEKVVAVLTCERQAAPFSNVEVQQLRLACDFAVARLADLKHHDRWFGARWASTARERLGKWVGPQHTWAKGLALTITVALILLFFLRVPYRVEGNFILRSDEVTYLTAPFDGFIDQVRGRPGDAVEAGASLVSLKTSELELEESAALADLNRYQREAEKARAANSLAEMRIALSLADQAQARLDIVRFRIRQAALKAPFAGIVIEGDLRERLGAPVRQADVLIKIARIDSLYVEATINERDIHELRGRTHGEIAFVTQPKLKYPVRIVTIEQAAVPKEQANVFLVRCAIETGVQPWWRPGMSGVSKFDIEKRTLFWILTHRTVDFLRMKLWW